MLQTRPGIGSVAVFCGSRPGHDPIHIQAAKTLGQGLAQSGLELVYGGGRTGMMGATADAVLSGGGKVFGVIPHFLVTKEMAHEDVTSLVVTDSMHSRKRLMFDRADAFVIMPGGLGTLDELAEIITWRQLDLHDKPILLCDINGWAQPVARVFEAYIEEGFAQPDTRRLWEILPDVASVLARLKTAERSHRNNNAALL